MQTVRHGQIVPEVTIKHALGPEPELPADELNLFKPVLPSCSVDVPFRLSWMTLGLPGLNRDTARLARSQLSGVQGTTQSS